MWLPSFLTFPISLPSLPSISLPANIQRRFLSYVLKRALGRFVVASGLDVERVQAQISQGLVELERLEINVEEINEFIPQGLPFTVVSGEVAAVAARVPFPNLWSDPLSLTVDSLTLDVAITPGSKSSKGSYRSHHVDLASSVTSAADAFVHDELDAFEGAELDRSIRESLVLNTTDPFEDDHGPGGPGAFPASDSPGGVETTTVLASLVERILARLECRVRNVRLRVRYADDERSGVLELRVGEIRYATEAAQVAETVPGPRTRVRVLNISGVAVYLLPIPPLPPAGSHLGPRFMSRSSSMSSASSGTASTQSSDSNADYHDMVMSQAVYDLRQSTMTSASGMTVFHSAIDEDTGSQSVGQGQPSSPDMERVAGSHLPEPAVPEPVPPNPFAPSSSSRGTSRSATPTPGASSEPSETMLLSLGSEDIVVRMTTTSAFRPPPDEAPLSPDAHSPSTNTSAQPPLPPASPASIRVDLAIGTVAGVLLPHHVAFLLAVSQAALGGRQSAKQAETERQDVPVSQPQFDARVRIKGVYMAMVYDMKSPSEEYDITVPQFFCRPASVFLPIGHIRLRLEDIVAAYHSPSVTPSPVKRDRKVKLKESPPKAPIVSLSIADASVFEYLASAESGDDEPPGGAFPVLIFDANLPRQYDVAPGASWGTQPQTRTTANLPSFPEFDSVDWRNANVQKRSGEKAWRVRPKGRGILRGAASPEPPSPPAVSIRKDLSDRDAGSVELLPVHIFLDLSFVERLLPVLRSLAPLIQTKSEPPPPPPPPAFQGVPRPMLNLRTASSIIDDLDAQAAFRHRVGGSHFQRILLTVRCPMIRLDIRCPAPPNRRGSWGDGAHLRSGIVTLDIHGLNTTVTDTPSAPASQRRPSLVPDPAAKGGINVEWQRMVFLFSRVPGGQRRRVSTEATSEKRSTAFLVIGPLAPEGDESVLLPTVQVYSDVAPVSGLKTQSVSCRIPSVQAKIRQSTVEGLQFFADDITHWLDGAFGDGSAPRPRDDLKMIGSRFFGSKASSSASSSAVDEEDDDPAATLLRAAISECEVVLIVPKATKDVSPEAPDRILSLHASDVDVKLESNTTEKQETSVILQAMDASIFHHANPDSKPSRLFGRTTSLSFTAHTEPLVHLRFSSITHADRTKETGIRLSANACGLFITKDLEWVHDLKMYAKTPEGVFEDVVPSEVTRINLLFSDVSARVDTPTLPGALVAVATVLEVRTAIESEADDSQVDIGVSGIHLLAVDDLAATTDLIELSSSFQHSLDAWKRAGYAQLVAVEAADVTILRSLLPQETMLVDVLHAKVKVTACADSLASLGALAGDLSKLVPQKAEPMTGSPKRKPVALDQTIDVFASVDLEAFGQAPDIVSGADMIDDDLPTNLDYLDHAARQHLSVPKTDRKTGETLRSWETPDEAEHIAEGNGATVKVFLPDGFADEAGYWDSLPVLKNGEETRMGRTRVRVQNCSVGVFLHDGYDWQRTRKAIEDEIKAMRRRLEKIKQLLASGQKADASIEQASSVLFNSVYIGLPDQRDDMDSTQLLAAIDEELLDLGIAETATESSWQPFPSHAGVRPPAAQKKSHVKLHGKRLSRSKRGQIEFSLDGLRADIDMYAPDDATASRVHVTASSFDILDHIKTSTWKKFLTEMKSDSRGNVRETDADMVRLEITTVRPDLPRLDEEIRVRAKILPLRLHVDQDALDFLKHFFSFTPPRAEEAGAEAEAVPLDVAPKTEPFFQFVEIFPVELKLDYKPKRVDYAALRQGKTIELMNFFHFDGAEMTLRHVTLSGITGSNRLSDMLQDIWTPDVKANQLADVISGVSPIRSMVNVGSGVADLILLPIEQYRKDGRLARGVQRGTNSFVKSTALEMMKLGARLATGTQVVLERAEGVLGRPGDVGDSVILEAADISDDEGSPGREKSRYANQPTNVREGLRGAYSSLSSNLNSAAQTILAVPMEVYEQSGDDGPFKAVVRAVPIAVLKPMIGASEAVSKTLWGLRNTLDPESRRETDDKYK